MANAFKILYQGQLGNTVATLATVGVGKSWVIKTITAVNTDSADRTFGLYANGTAGSNAITPRFISVLASGGAWEWTEVGLTLEAAGTLAGGANVAAAITVTVFGDEVS